MQEHTHTTSLLLLKKKNEHKVLVICARSKNNIKESKKTQGNSGKFLVTQRRFFDSKSGHPDFTTRCIPLLDILRVKKCVATKKLKLNLT